VNDERRLRKRPPTERRKTKKKIDQYDQKQQINHIGKTLKNPLITQKHKNGKKTTSKPTKGQSRP